MIDALAYKPKTFEKYAAAGTTYWQTTQQYKAVVPSGKRWILLGINTYRDQNGTLSVAIRDASDEYILYVGADGAATGWCVFPNRTDGDTMFSGFPIIVDEGEYIDIAFGAAQTTGAHCTVHVLEVDL